ncbi:MAG: GPP34 family phosphoprotein [Nocardioides sp.]
MVMLIAEDLLLLLLDDDKGTLQTAYPQTVLGGALLVELALAEAIVVEEKSSVWRAAKVRPAADHPPEDELLRSAYDLIAEKERTAQDLVDRLGKGALDRLAERLVGRGILERRSDRLLGVFPRTRWPASDTTHEDETRRALTAALVQGATPDERTGALVALLHAVDKAHKVVDRDGLSAGTVRKRAKEISETTWAARAVRDAISASTAAIAAVAVGGAVVAGSS